MKTDSEIQIEMDWTPYHESCLDPSILPNSEGRLCRRSRGHENFGDLDHASGRDNTFYRWQD